MKLLWLVGVLSLYIAFINGQNAGSTVAPEETTAAAERTTVTEGPSTTITDSTTVTSTTVTPTTQNTTTGSSNDTTTVSTTTLAPTTTAPSTGDHQYFVTNTSTNAKCIVMNATLFFNITYFNKTAAIASQFEVPGNKETRTSGDCNAAYIQFAWTPTKGTKEWTAKFDFAKDVQNSYYVKTVTLAYVMTDDLFPGTNYTGDMQAQATNQTWFKSANGNYYLCKSDEQLVLNAQVLMLTKDLAIQAYRSSNSTDFKGTAQQCPKDAETNNIVPIAVGAALAALVVIVLIAYLISRNRNKGGYESV